MSTAVSKAKEYLADNQPGPAALVLDALTVALLPADSERYFLMMTLLLLMPHSFGNNDNLVNIKMQGMAAHIFITTK